MSDHITHCGRWAMNCWSSIPVKIDKNGSGEDWGLVILIVQHFVPFSPKYIIQPVLYPDGHFRGEEPVRDVWVVDNGMYTYAISRLAAFRMRHKLVQLWQIIFFSRADHPKECQWR